MSEHTVEQVIEMIAQQFVQSDLYYGHGTDNALDEAAWAVHHVLQLDYSGPIEQYQQAVATEKYGIIKDLANHRISSRKPMAYLTNTMWFAGIDFYVDERVLVPRSPFAELITNNFGPWLDGSSVSSALDLCTGSGCIGMAIARYMPDVYVTASDISTDAINVATINQERLGLQDRVELVQADLFDGIPSQSFDLIVSNPPYVSTDEMQSLPEEFKQEPELGLVSGMKGLDHVDRILKEAFNYLSDDGHLIIEVGNTSVQVQEVYPQVPFMWLEFEQGGDGVFMLTAQQLKNCFG